MWLTPRTLDLGAEALSGIRGSELWRLLELLWGLSAGITPAVTLATLFRAKSTKWHHWGAHVLFNPLLGAFPPACELWWWQMGGAGQGCSVPAQELHCTRWQSQTFAQLSRAQLIPSEPALVTRSLREKGATAAGLGFLCMDLSIQN